MTANAARKLETPEPGLATAYRIETPEEAKGFYDAWAESYDAELAENRYATPQRCAAALAAHAADREAPLIDLACGTGLSGRALSEAGFTCIDGVDISEGMLEKARETGLYRRLGIMDLSQPLDLSAGAYANAAAIGCISPDCLPPSVIYEVLATLPRGGCFVFSVNDHAAQDGTVAGRIMELVDTCYADLLVSDYGAHIPGIGMKATVYVLRRR